MGESAGAIMGQGIHLSHSMYARSAARELRARFSLSPPLERAPSSRILIRVPPLFRVYPRKTKEAAAFISLSLPLSCSIPLMVSFFLAAPFVTEDSGAIRPLELLAREERARESTPKNREILYPAFHLQRASSGSTFLPRRLSS